MNLLATVLIAAQLLTPQVALTPQRDPDVVKVESQLKEKYHLEQLPLRFEVLPKSNTYNEMGVYYPASDTLKLNYFLIVRVANTASVDLEKLVDNTMRHELAHHRVDKLRERLHVKTPLENEELRKIDLAYADLLMEAARTRVLRSGRLQKFGRQEEKRLRTILLDRMVNEGIALYYEDPSVELAAVTWPRSVEEIANYELYDRLIYDTGRSLMAPFIKKYGERGIIEVLRHMPKPADFPHLQAYQARVLQRLERRYPGR